MRLTSKFTGYSQLASVDVNVTFDGTPLRGDIEGPVGWVPNDEQVSLKVGGPAAVGDAGDGYVHCNLW